MKAKIIIATIASESTKTTACIWLIRTSAKEPKPMLATLIVTA
jgi:hypothetical protein